MTGCFCSKTARRWTADGCATCGQPPTERQLEPVILAILCGNTGLILWRNQSGHATYQGKGGKEYHVDYGVGNPPGGGGDYVGIYSPGGARWVEVEMKTVIGQLSPLQRARRDLVVRLNAVYAVVRSESDARALLAWLRDGGVRPGFVFCKEER
jgi:hypothetical protein